MPGDEDPEPNLELGQNDKKLKITNHTKTRNPTEVREVTPPSCNHALAESKHRDARTAGRTGRDDAERGRVLDAAQL